MDNQALKIADALAPFLQPAPSSDTELIKTIADFSLEVNPAQNAALTMLEMLTFESLVPETERKKIQVYIANWERRKRYHDAKMFIDSAVKSLSYRRFAESGLIQGKIDKMQSA